MPGIYNETGQHGDYDQSEPVWKASTAVVPGDLIVRDTAGYDIPAGAYTWNTDIGTTRDEARDAFRGVSMARRLASDAAAGGRGHGLILASGEFRFPLDAAAEAVQAVGSYVTFAKQSGNLLESQKVNVAAATQANAIGRLTKDVRIGDLYATFKIFPALSGHGNGVLAYYGGGTVATVGVTASPPG